MPEICTEVRWSFGSIQNCTWRDSATPGGNSLSGISELNGYSRDHSGQGNEAVTNQSEKILLNTSAIT